MQKFIDNDKQIEIVGHSYTDVHQRVEKYIAENGKPRIRSGIAGDRHNKFRFVCSLFYKMER